MGKRVIIHIFYAAIVFLPLFFLQRLVMPKYMEEPLEGAMIAEYYQEEKNHDVIFIGDCELYENISPATLWEEYGIHSYIRGSANQLIWQSYYLLEETFAYEKPKVVVYNVLAMKYDTPQSEAYNRMTLDGMRWSASKIKSIRSSMTEGEHTIDYIFPLLRFHSRITELEGEDFAYLFHREKVTYNGYLMQTGVKPMEVIPEGKPLADYMFSDIVWEYLDKMAALCRENQVELVLVKAPVLYPYWYGQWDEQIAAYAAENHLKYYNLIDKIHEIGIDFQTDTYDGGLHLNVYGAEKVAQYFGQILSEKCGVKDRRGEEKLAEEWSGKLERYRREKGQ